MSASSAIRPATRWPSSKARTAFSGLTAHERTQLLGLIQKAFESLSELDLTQVPTGARHRPPV